MDTEKMESFIVVSLIVSFFMNGLSALQCYHVGEEDSCRDNNCNYNCSNTKHMPACQIVYGRNASNKSLYVMHASCWGQCSAKNSSCVLRPGATNMYSCCCKTDLCNLPENVIIEGKNLVRTTRSTRSTEVRKPNESISSSKLALIFVTICLPLIAAFAIGSFWRVHKKNKENRRNTQDHIQASPPVQSRPIQFHEEISRGKYSSVWRGTYEHKQVAVKILLPNERDSWETERSIYCDNQLWHENILRFHSAEKRCEAGCDQYWIITEFHEKGSLADYLSATVLDYNDLLKILLSIVSGLVYLHEDEPSRVPPKPAIAHRDFKSRNVLVKPDGSCCIGDFGLACSFFDGHGSEESKLQVGTKRYMAPEVLQGAVGFQTESFLSIDVYSLALVMWECLTRCNVTGTVDTYRVAFENEVGQHPTIDDMRVCVVDRHCRPIIKPEWQNNEMLSLICNTTEECWDDDADARLSASCVYERLSSLCNVNRSEECVLQVPEVDTENRPLLTSAV